MTEYNILVSCPELSLSETVFKFDLPEIKFDGVVKNTVLVEQVFDELKKLRITSLKSSLLGLLQGLI